MTMVLFLVSGWTVPAQTAHRLSLASLNTLPTLVITQQLQDLTVPAGSDATFSVGVRGSGTLVYRWTKNGLTLPQGAFPSLTLTNVNTSHAGSYAVAISNLTGQFVVSRSAVLTVTSPNALVITQQPQDLTVPAGSDATFSVGVQGSGTLVYRWTKNGRPLPQGAFPSLTLTNVNASHAGAYAVAVSNLTGQFVVSRSAILTVADATPLRILSPPQDWRGAIGSTATFSVQAEGSGTLTYAWFKDGVALTNETQSTLVIRSVDASSAGAYTVAVRDGTSQLTAGPAHLVVVGSRKIFYFHKYVPVSNLAGSDGIPGDVVGPAVNARLNSPNGGFFGPDGSLYFADTGNHRIKKVTQDGEVVLVAGSGQPGFANGPRDSARFQDPIGVCVGPDGTVYVADYGNHRVRRISPAGLVSTLAGNGLPGFADGPGHLAQLHHPNDLALGPDGLLYVTEFSNHVIRRIAPSGDTVTWVGTGTPGSVEGFRTVAQLDQPAGITVNAEGDLFLTEWGHPRIRKVSTKGQVSTVAGSGVPGHRDGPAADSTFDQPDGIALDGMGNIFIADRGNHALRRISLFGDVRTVSGTGTPGGENANVEVARFNTPSGIAIDADGNLFVADTGTHRIRRINTIASVAQHDRTVLADAPVGFWKLDWEDDEVDMAADVTGRHSGTYVGDISWGLSTSIESGLVNSAYSVEEDAMHVSIPYHADLNPSRFTIEFWAVMTEGLHADFVERRIVTSVGPGAPNGFFIRALTPGEWELVLGNGVRWVSVVGPTVEINRWTHLMASYDGTRARLYIDGQLRGSRVTTFVPNTGGILRIGTTSTESPYFGAIDELAVYPSALSSERVLTHFAAGTRSTRLTAQIINQDLTLIWFNGSLQGAPTLDGPWTDLPSTTSPWSFAPTDRHRFFQLRR